MKRPNPERKRKALQHDGPVKRRQPLKRTMQLRSSGPLPPQSAKARQLAVDRRSFVADFLAKNPRCQVRWNGGCTGWAVHVHEAIRRSQGGVIVPTPGRDQLFIATCWWCHAQVHDHPAEAVRRGFLLTHDRDRRPAATDPPPDVAQGTQDYITAMAARYGLG